MSANEQALNAEHKLLERHLRKTTIVSNIISLVVAIIAAMAVVYGFYYHTTDTLNEHGTQIQEVKKDVGEIKTEMKDIAVDRGISNTEIKQLQEDVKSIKATQEKQDDKLDKILMQTK